VPSDSLPSVTSILRLDPEERPSETNYVTQRVKKKSESPNREGGPEAGKSLERGLSQESLMTSRKSRQHLSPLDKFKRRAMNKIREHEEFVEQIKEVLTKSIDKDEVHQLNVAEKVSLGKDLVMMMQKEKERTAFESQVLKDRIEIQERVHAEKGYHKKMARLRQMLKECPTSKHYESLTQKQKFETRRQIKQVEESRQKILKDDITKLAQHQS